MKLVSFGQITLALFVGLMMACSSTEDTPGDTGSGSPDASVQADSGTQNQGDTGTQNQADTGAQNQPDSGMQNQPDGGMQNQDAGQMMGANNFCLPDCSIDSDCFINGNDIGAVCLTGYCQADQSNQCDDNDCRIQFSGWATDCTNDTECPGQVCVDIGGGVGKCATAPIPGALECVDINMAEVMVTAIGGGMVTVCQNQTARCSDQNFCFIPCPDQPCGADMQCNMTTGFCECANDNACGTNTSVCVNGQCQCADNSDCTFNADTCLNGVCGCSDVSVCVENNPYANSNWVCMGL